MKLKRSAHRFFLNVKGDSPEWYWVGKDIEDLSVEMNGTFETRTNIMDETSVSDEGYAPSVSATPYYADPEDAIYSFLEDIALNRKSGDDCKAECLEVIVKDTESATHKAWKEDCKIEIVSYGGPTDGYQIEFNVHPSGNRVEGTAKIENKVPTFTAGTEL